MVFDMVKIDALIRKRISQTDNTPLFAWFDKKSTLKSVNMTVVK